MRIIKKLVRDSERKMERRMKGRRERKMKGFAEAYLEPRHTSAKLLHRRCSTGFYMRLWVEPKVGEYYLTYLSV